MQDKEFVPNCCAGVESCDSDTDSSEDEQSSAAVSLDFLSESDQSISQNTAGQVNARNGTVWKNITGAPGLGKACSSNVFLERPGPTSYCHRSVVNGSPYSAFHLFVDEHMLRMSIFNVTKFIVLIVVNLTNCVFPITRKVYHSQ